MRLNFADRNRRSRRTAASGASSFALRFGYVVALIISLYVLWTFGRTDGMAIEEIIKAVIVLGFPAALGASTSRLIL